jgi:hypothetical protein
MNAQLFSFALFLLWAGVAVTFLVILPVFAPNALPQNFRNQLLGLEKGQLLGYGAAALAVWNLVRWWSVRAAARTRRMEEEMEREYRQRTSSPERSDQPKPILHPEFNFDDPSPDPPSANGKGKPLS